MKSADLGVPKQYNLLSACPLCAFSHLHIHKDLVGDHSGSSFHTWVPLKVKEDNQINLRGHNHPKVESVGTATEVMIVGFKLSIFNFLHKGCDSEIS